MAIAVSIIMGVVFVYQLYWLNGLHRTTSSQLEKDIFNAMDIADQYELAIRSEIIEIDSLAGDKSVSMNVGVKEDSIGKQVYYSYDTASQDTVNQAESDEAGFNQLSENVKTTENLAAYIKKTMHYINDPLLSININVFDSLLTKELIKEDIDQPHQVFTIRTSNDSICFASDNNADFNIKYAGKYDFYYDLNGEHAYRLYIKNPNRHVLSQMVGMLLTSLIILIFLIFIFVYLLKIIRKLQTEEELKNNFTNNMTHELKTPIAVSYAAVDALLIADKPASKERQKKYLNIAKEQMNYLSGQVEQILNMSRRDNSYIELKIESINLANVVDGVSEKLQLVSDKKVEIKTQFDVPIVKADKLHLTNILNNLMENSMKYSGDKVQITVSSWVDENNLFIAVEDNGIGIERKYQEKLFEKFYRIPIGNRYNVKGFGLGLFYVKEMVEKHGGTVDVKSQPNKGSIFTLKIPQ
jgi:signal transduction histidine kinase